MESAKLWMLLVLTACGWNAASGCTWMKTPSRGSQSMFQVFSNHTITMLELMGDDVPRDTMTDFPEKQYNLVLHSEAEDKITFICQTLTAVMKLYGSGRYTSSEAGDDRQVDKFENALYRQTSELHQCVKAMKRTSSASVKRANKKMHVHFKHLNNWLKDEEYSASAWDDVRTVVLAHLRRLDLLAATLRSTSQ